MTHILIIEDEPAVAELTKFIVQEAGWSSRVVTSVAAGWEAIQYQEPHLILLDWMLPDQTGLSLLAKLRSDRQLKKIPVIMLTARQMEEDKIAGLDHGADDYITKPFSPRELTARMKALLRRRSPEHAQETIEYGGLVLDPSNFSVSLAGKKIEIGHTEYKLLKFLLAYPDRVFSRSQLLDRVWGNHVIIEERTVDVHVLRLRKVLGSAESLIRTVRGVGYMLSDK
jgi:two-component system phosphate regulon response regulator PhoB